MASCHCRMINERPADGSVYGRVFVMLLPKVAIMAAIFRWFARFLCFSFLTFTCVVARVY
jgi:hypothetical protein